MKLDNAIKIELQIFKENVRQSKEKLGDILSVNFEEIDFNGNKRDRVDVLESVNKENLGNYKIIQENFELVFSKEDCFAIRYVSFLMVGDEKIRKSIRTSIWEKNLEKWNLLSHQATPIV